jgi:thiol-disulfide isomerase/thioredoxin
MSKKILYILLLLSISNTYCQDSIVYFSDALESNINQYIKASNHAFEKKDFIEGKRLFDSLVQHKLVGTLFDDFSLKGYNTKNVKSNKINKPIFLITYSSWCVINKGDAPALNKLAKEYAKDVQIIILFWDKKSDIKKIANQFNNEIKICYANETYINDFSIIARLKHTLGFPTSFFIDENKKVINISRIPNQYKPKTSFTKALEISYLKFNTVINESLLQKTTDDAPLATN